MTYKVLYGKKVKLNPLVNHTIIIGKSGSGKSNSMEVILTSVFDKKNTKCFDIYDSGRFENAMYNYEEDRHYMLEQLKVHRRKPKRYPMKYYMICGNNLKYQNKLPKNFILASFDMKSLTLSDIFYLLATSPPAQSLLTEIAMQHGESINILDLFNIIKSHPVRGSLYMTKNAILYNLLKLLYSGMFSENAEKLDFKKIIRDTENISCFNTKLLENEFEGIAYGLILKSIFHYKRSNEDLPNVLACWREFHHVLAKTLSNPSYKMARRQMIAILREGRDYGIDLLGDTQLVNDLVPMTRYQFGVKVQLRTDYEEAEKFLQFSGDIPKSYLVKVSKLEVGRGIIVAGGDWHYPVMFPPAPIRHKVARSQVMKWLLSQEGVAEYDPDDYLEKHELKIHEPKPKKKKRKRYPHKCKKCGYEWQGWTEKPRQCPNCKSQKWH